MELQRDEALTQLSLLKETSQQWDEALARATVLQHKHSKQAKDLKSLTLAVENSQLQQ